MKKVSLKGVGTPIALLSLALFLYLWKENKLGSIPVVGRLFWPTYAPQRVKDWLPIVQDAVPYHHMLILAIIWQESSGVHAFDNGELNMGGDGEVGLCQILPSTGEGLGYSVADLTDPVKNINACFDYIEEAHNSWQEWYNNPDNCPPSECSALVSVYDILRYYNCGPKSQRLPYCSAQYAEEVLHKLDILAREFDAFSLVEDIRLPPEIEV